MSMNITFFVNGEPFSTGEGNLTVAEIRDRGGGSGRDCCVVREDGTEHRDPDEILEVRDQEKFQVKEPTSPNAPVEVGVPVRYKVNGEEQSTTVNPLAVGQILKNAGDAASIDIAQLDSYFLERISDGRKYEKLAEEVSIEEGDQFLAVHVGRTPVA